MPRKLPAFYQAGVRAITRFVERASRVLIVDSRVKNVDFPPYKQIDRRNGCTRPDLDESAEFRDVRIYAV